MNQPHRRRGLTRVELIVVLFLVLPLLAAILLPAIQRARESARLAQCKHNLKEIGLALHNYHDTFVTTLPPGFVMSVDDVYHGWGWELMVAPYLDASPYFNDLGRWRSVGISSLQRQPVKNGYKPVLNCPSTAGSLFVEHVLVCTGPVVNGEVTPATADWTNYFGRSTYFGNAGYLKHEVGGLKPEASGEPPVTEPFVNAGSIGNSGSTFSIPHRYLDQKNFGGVFGQNSNIGIHDMKDGAANVFMVGERYTPAHSKAGSVGYGILIGVPDCATNAGLAMAFGDTSIKINAGTRQRAETTGFGSSHSGGAHFVMGDGVVRFITNGIDIKLFRDLSTINDGEVRGF